MFLQVLGGTLLQQTFVVEFTVHNQMCEDCHRVEAKDYWRSCVQVRQKVCTDACLTQRFTPVPAGPQRDYDFATNVPLNFCCVYAKKDDLEKHIISSPSRAWGTGEAEP